MRRSSSSFTELLPIVSPPALATGGSEEGGHLTIDET